MSIEQQARELPALPMHKGCLYLHNTGSVSQVWGYTAQQMRDYAMAALAQQPRAPAAAVPEAWRAFVASCAETCGGMVNGNILSRAARELLDSAGMLAAAPAPEAKP